MNKNTSDILIWSLGTVIISIFLIFSFFYLRISNEKAVWRKYDLKCFSGCIHESKCPMVGHYDMYSDEEIQKIIKDQKFDIKEFEKLKTECNNKTP